MIPDTNFPDIRNKTAIHSTNGSCMTIPREGDIVRFYIQLSDRDVVDPVSGRVDKSRMSPEKLLEVRKLKESQARSSYSRMPIGRQENIPPIRVAQPSGDRMVDSL
jgi:hypothetical protein